MSGDVSNASMPADDPATATPIIINAELVEADTAALDELGRRFRFVEQEYGDGHPFDLEKSIAKTQIYLTHSAESLLQSGRELIRIKEHVPHGEFTNVLKEHIKISPQTARKMMQAAAKFLSSEGKRSLASVLSPTKLLELLTEDDKDLDALTEGGTLAGYTLDEIEAMTKAELREALRKARDKAKQDKGIFEKQLARKDQKLNQLDAQLHRQDEVGWHNNIFEMNLAVTNAAAHALEQIDELELFRDRILNFEQQNGVEEMSLSESSFDAMAVVYYDACRQVFDAANSVMYACHDVFTGYKHKARPLVELGGDGTELIETSKPVFQPEPPEIL